ncbi:MAG: hypothetical protein A3G57_04740 [Candidatus Andersenbacteria bacterium RIFCSPLOWO2_12_FULL_45_8]|nr:MAG: hypothetical protein A3G57_04740 [Candidatus Andersenbacteria bacterium RIFCSPLOWO2_12_FULL_45_8]
MREIGLIRHGAKFEGGKKRVPLEESGLTAEQQERWAEAVERLDIQNDPELSYDSVPQIEKLAARLNESLPERATVLFLSSDYPRTKLTADLLSSSLIGEVQKAGKDVGVGFVWEPKEEAAKPGSVSKLPQGTPEIMEAMKEVAERDCPDDESLKEYFISNDGSITHPKEDELVMKAVNEQISDKDSFIGKRVALLKEQVENLKAKFPSGDRPVYVYGIGHHGSLIALDVAYNGRDKYDSVDEIPKPLSLWKVNLEKI